MENRWSIGLAAWIIQDGNYGDFAAGDRAEFAVEFYAPDELADAIGAQPHASHLGDGMYDITARVVHAHERGWVLDFGILAYREEEHFPTMRARGVEVGSLVTGRVSLGVDPFFYFEALARIPEWPDLIYTWDVREIWRETAPFVQSGNVHVRDESRRARVSVPRTDAWHDDSGNGDYLFVCDLVAAARKRTSATAH